MAGAECQYFYEDVVYRVDKKGNVVFGIVMESDDPDVSEESSDGEESPKRKKGEARVVWHPSGAEELVNSKKVHLADRTLMPGDVVRRMIKGKDTQRGYCRDVGLTVCAQVIGSKQVLTNIRSEDLVPLQEFATDIAVCMDSWVGGIRMTHFKLWLTTPDGSRCVMNEMETTVLMQLEEKQDSVNDFPRSMEFYPGQSLWGPVHCLDQAQWLHCTKEMKAKRNCKSYKFTKMLVEKVETDWVGVHWQCRAFSKDGNFSDEAQPKFVVEGEDLKRLKLLNVFEPSTVQVGDRNFYVIKGDENVVSREQWMKMQSEIYQVPKQVQKKPKPNISVTKPADEQTKEKESEEIQNNLNHQRQTQQPNQQQQSQQQRNQQTQPNQQAPSDQQQHGNQKHFQQQQLNTNCLMPPMPPQNESSDDWDTEDTGSQSDTASVSSGCSSMSSMGKKKKGPALMTKVLKKKKLCKARKKVPPVQLVPGTKIVVETLNTNTKATVVWQDGSVEFGVPSTQLYPIHHLDDKEFFPGDFVVDQKEETRMYGVVQSVDHQGRTAKIKWFKTYTSTQSPQPTLLEEREVSVYDLKDHPDFQYRPGTLVIRIANFEGEDSGCTAGQVLDNYPEGRVKVSWVDGHVSMCWPQDLYKVGEYDSDEGELWDDGSSDASWKTELEDCFIADMDGTEQTELDSIKPKLAAHIEKARIAMSRLEEIFTQNPALQTTEVMRKLLEVYKDCRNMDKLMGTSFFHESHFQGLLERVRERGRQNVAQRMADQVNRLFTTDGVVEDEESQRNSDNADDSKNFDKSLDKSTGSASLSESPAVQKGRGEVSPISKCNPEDSGLFSVENSKKESGSSESSGEFLLSEDQPKKPDVKSIDVKYSDTKIPKTKSSQNLSPTTIQSAESLVQNAAQNLTQNVTQSPSQYSVQNSHVCVRLCTLIKAQLVLAHAEVSRRFGLSRMSLSEAEKEKRHAKEKSKKPENNVDPVDPVKSVDNAELTDLPKSIYKEGEGFSIEESAPDSHKFKLTMFQPTEPTNFFRTVSKEIKLLKGSLPPGVWVKGFEDRIDLYSVMFRGPQKTPYEDGLFLFDFQLSADYPAAPPLCHYISYCSDRLNPNLYEDGKVCVSLLGTWSGRGTEVWTSSSTLLQVIVSIQGLILVSEPYFNEAGFEKQKGSQQGRENSRMYNEMVVLKLVQAQTKLLQHPPAIFKDVILAHFKRHGEKLLKRLEFWMEISEQHNAQHPLSPVTPTTFKQIADVDKRILPEFPLIPASRGFCITLRKSLATFKEVLAAEGIIPKEQIGADSGSTSDSGSGSGLASEGLKQEEAGVCANS